MNKLHQHAQVAAILTLGCVVTALLRAIPKIILASRRVPRPPSFPVESIFDALREINVSIGGANPAETKEEDEGEPDCDNVCTEA